MGRLSHTRAELERDLRRMGLRAGSIVIVHSSMKSIGQVSGGPVAVIRALKAAVGRSGTILMPTFSYSLERVYEPTEPYDPARSRARTGLIPETFRCLPGVLRSLHPTHSVGAWGARAARYIEGHEGRSAFDADTPLHRAALDGAVVLMIGCSFTALSLLHVAESLAPVPYLGVFCWAHRGHRREAAVRGGASVAYPSVPGCSRSFGILKQAAERAGLVRHASLGNADVLVLPARGLLELAVKRLRARSDAFLCPPTTCRACDERRVVFQGRTAAARRVRSFLIDSTSGIGIRLAGSPGERQAAETIAARLAALGIPSPRVQELPIPAWEPGFASAQVRVGSGGWQEVACAPCAHAPATPAAGIEAETVNVESVAELDKLGRGRGRIAVLWDGYGASAREIERLMSWGFRGFVYVDRRFAHAERVAVGFPARWVRYLSAPMLSVPFPEAARLFGHERVRVRMRIAGRTRPGVSCNVIGELPGRSRETIVVCAHHDSTFNSVAADDNLTGVAAMLEIARALSRGRRLPRRTLRFCSFGAEELLSEGARAYAIDSAGARSVRFVLNNDSIGARVGSTDVCVTGPDELEAWIKRRTKGTTLQFRFAKEVSPFSDHFPFNVAGAPSLWFYRPTLATGRHFHHTTYDGLAELSMDLIAETAKLQAGLVAELAEATRWPFAPRLPPALAVRVAEAGRNWIDSGA